jgi:hypothetical protein
LPVLSSDSVAGVVIAILAGFLTAVAYFDGPAVEKKREAWLTEWHLYEHGWVCVRCGHTWIPGQQPSEPNTSKSTEKKTINMDKNNETHRTLTGFIFRCPGPPAPNRTNGAS